MVVYANAVVWNNMIGPIGKLVVAADVGIVLIVQHIANVEIV
jgi:hypothetical protein